MKNEEYPYVISYYPECFYGDKPIGKNHPCYYKTLRKAIIDYCYYYPSPFHKWPLITLFVFLKTGSVGKGTKCSLCRNGEEEEETV